MEYETSVQMKLPIFVQCKDCKLWFPADYNHCYFENIDTTTHNYNINLDTTL
jgi:hypothetical protein